MSEAFLIIVQTQTHMEGKCLLNLSSNKSNVYKASASSIPEDGSEMTLEEVNALLVMSLERIDKLQESLKASSAAAKRHTAMALQKYKIEADRITQEAVHRAIHREQIKCELERFEWVRCSISCFIFIILVFSLTTLSGLERIFMEDRSEFVV